MLIVALGLVLASTFLLGFLYSKLVEAIREAEDEAGGGHPR
jgi:VIT1/CCC1 family predicted Fe2+/Mn2+ transporter